ncbi:MAG: hypothetical protein IKQ33_03715 [Clostridia bacterium]|nr:hypothetical protein [Clostridia bacterium]
MNSEKFFESNNVEDVVKKIQAIVGRGDTLYIMFPFYNPAFGLNLEYDVVGKAENQLLIAKKLKEKYVDSIRVEESPFFVFFSDDVSEKEREEIKKDALRVAAMYDIID